MQKKFPNLLSRASIGGLDVGNRIVMAPIGTANALPDGQVTSRNIAYYKAIAEGGTGFIVVESSYPDDLHSKGEDGQIGVSNGSHTPGLALLATVIHNTYGAKCAIQICHEGQQISLIDRLESWAPSDMVMDVNGSPVTYRGMSVEEIHQLEEDFATAAWRAKIAGFDAVEVHASGGHLLNMFCSPVYNKRTDEYGGSIENRVRLTLETIEAIRKKCGKKFPIIVRWCADDFDEGGLNIDDSIEMAKLLDEVGVAALSINGGSLSNGILVPTMHDERATYMGLSKKMKEAGIKTPIILTGSITTPDLAEKILAEGSADFIGLARPLLADPDWIKKIKADEPEDIKPCIRCSMGCVGTYEEYVASKGLSCAVNPCCNLTEYRTVKPIESKKNVAVVGGGPAGMEAARLAALRGHDVTLYEMRKLGGVMHEASFDDKLKHDIKFLIDYYVTQMKKLDIKVVEERATAADILDGEYDAVVVATGAKAKILKVPGYDKPHVYSDIEATGDTEKDLGKSVIVVGGGVIAAEIAISQAMKGRKVTLTTRRGQKMMQWEIASDDSAPSWQRIIALLDEYDVNLELMMTLKEVTDDGVILTDMDGDDNEIKGDSVIMCTGYEPENSLYRLLNGRLDELYIIGDAVKARTIGDAIHEGWSVANQI